MNDTWTMMEIITTNKSGVKVWVWLYRDGYPCDEHRAVLGAGVHADIHRGVRQTCGTVLKWYFVAMFRYVYLYLFWVFGIPCALITFPTIEWGSFHRHKVTLWYSWLWWKPDMWCWEWDLQHAAQHQSTAATTTNICSLLETSQTTAANRGECSSL